MPQARSARGAFRCGTPTSFSASPFWPTRRRAFSIRPTCSWPGCCTPRPRVRARASGQDAPALVAWSLVLHAALAACGAYLYARRIPRLSPLPALLGASAFAFGGFLSGQAEHVNQLNVSAWFPLLLLLWEARTKARWPALLGLGAVIGIGLLAGHTQSSYITLAGLGVYAVVEAFLPRRHGEHGEEEKRSDAQPLSRSTDPLRALPEEHKSSEHSFLLRVLRVSVVPLLSSLWQLGIALLDRPGAGRRTAAAHAGAVPPLDPQRRV